MARDPSSETLTELANYWWGKTKVTAVIQTNFSIGEALCR